MKRESHNVKAMVNFAKLPLGEKCGFTSATNSLKLTILTNIPSFERVVMYKVLKYIKRSGTCEKKNYSRLWLLFVGLIFTVR
jgi:hypothetical protein